MSDKYINIDKIFNHHLENNFSLWLGAKGFESYARLAYMAPIFMGKCSDIDNIEKLGSEFLQEEKSYTKTYDFVS